MNRTLYIVALALGLFGCNGKSDETVDHSTVPKAAGDKIKLSKLEKLFVVGDFDGDQQMDTIFQHNYSRLTRTEIDSSADPFANDWDTVAQWFYDQDADLYLTLGTNSQDTLRLGTAPGLYCLINIGDNNEDGKDEVALVIDHLDFSSMNSCRIYTLCNDKWALLKQFRINEDAFEYVPADAPPRDNISDFLEKQNGTWVFKEYPLYDSDEDVPAMEPLKLESCK